jgi:hypothetical protein
MTAEELDKLLAECTKTDPEVDELLAWRRRERQQRR